MLGLSVVPELYLRAGKSAITRHEYLMKQLLVGDSSMTPPY